jgi:glutamine phosphoribosylpyrophosphate amidotransferase
MQLQIGYSNLEEQPARSFANHVGWMANEFSHWVAYRALTAGRLIAIRKSPGVRPVRIGEKAGNHQMDSSGSRERRQKILWNRPAAM